MERPDAIEYYIHYMLCAPRNVTATGISETLDGVITHDYISDALSQGGLSQKVFWQKVKPFVRKIEDEDAVLSIDDFIIDKPHSGENNVIAYHYDHTRGRSVKGINVLNFMLSSSVGDTQVNCPVSFHVVEKPIKYIDEKTGKERRKSNVKKNQVVIDSLHRLCKLNQVAFKYVLFDSWFGSSATLKYIHRTLNKKFVCPLKVNRLVALSEQDKLAGQFVPVSEVGLEKGMVTTVWVKGIDFPMLLSRQVYTNKDRSTSEQWLITNDTTLTAQQMLDIYQKRWKIEEMHKSLKQNVLIGKSPTKMEVTQKNHLFLAMLAFIELERLKIKERLNHFALKAKLQLKMVKAAMDELYAMKAAVH